MKLFILYIIILFLFRIVLMSISKRNYPKVNVLLCSIAYIGLIFLAAFRAPEVGTDTLSTSQTIRKYTHLHGKI